MRLRVHSVVVTKEALARFPELASVFAYIDRSLDKIVTDAKDAKDLLQFIDKLVVSAIGGTYLRSVLTDSEHNEVAAEDVGGDACIMLVEAGIQTLH
jgi:hypothetical protein